MSALIARFRMSGGMPGHRTQIGDELRRGREVVGDELDPATRLRATRSARSAWRRARSARVSVPYATSRTSSDLKRKPSSSKIRRSRSASESSTSPGASTDVSASASAKSPVEPTTAQSSSSERSVAGSASSRAATRPCSVAGSTPMRAAAPGESECLDLAHQRDELFDEERVAAAALEQEVEHVVGEVLAEQLPCEAGRGLGVERVDVHDERVVVPAGQRPPLLEAGARGPDEHEREVAQALQQPFDQVEDEIVGPVEVGEREHERPVGARGLRGTPRPIASRRRVHARARRPDGRNLRGCRASPRRHARSPKPRSRRAPATTDVAQLLADRHVAVLVARRTPRESPPPPAPTRWRSRTARTARRAPARRPTSLAFSANSSTSRLLPMPASPSRSTSCARRRRRAIENACRSTPISASRPTSAPRVSSTRPSRWRGRVHRDPGIRPSRPGRVPRAGRATRNERRVASRRTSRDRRRSGRAGPRSAAGSRC